MFVEKKQRITLSQPLSLLEVFACIKILFPEYIQKQNANGRSKETDFFSVPFEKALPFVSVSIIRSSDSCLLVTFC